MLRHAWLNLWQKHIILAGSTRYYSCAETLVAPFALPEDATKETLFVFAFLSFSWKTDILEKNTIKMKFFWISLISRWYFYHLFLCWTDLSCDIYLLSTGPYFLFPSFLTGNLVFTELTPFRVYRKMLLAPTKNLFRYQNGQVHHQDSCEAVQTHVKCENWLNEKSRHEKMTKWLISPKGAR